MFALIHAEAEVLVSFKFIVALLSAASAICATNRAITAMPMLLAMPELCSYCLETET